MAKRLVKGALEGLSALEGRVVMVELVGSGGM